MKKLVALLLAVLMLSMSALALAEAPEGYPEVVPGIDFGGKTVKIYTWYSMDRSANPTDEEADLYAYQDWLQEVYNVKVEYEVPYDWAGSITYLTDFVTAETKDLVIFTMPMDFIGPAMKNNMIIAWNDLIDLTAEKWNQGTLEFMTTGGKTLGVYSGGSEPRECVFFNKQQLIDANIDPDYIYDLQANGEWTWDKMLEIFAQVQKDIDGDGVIDIWASTGSGDDMAMGAIASNGASFYKLVDGKLEVNINTEEFIEAIEYAKTIRDNYFRRAQTDAEGNTENWDYYKQGFVQGQGVFRFGQTWEGYNGNEAMNADGFEWGCVAFPTGPKVEPGAYKNIVNDNITCIPNVYDAETNKMLAVLYDQWSNPTPGYEDDTEGWIGNKYNYTDDRAVDETYAMLRSAEYTVRDYYVFTGDKNATVCPDLLWPIDSDTAAALVESVLPVFQARADDFNNK
ncbi:MAG: hypothetical protein E7324_01860 [Clostridiales bacterium]|nr:hypothetical protein [Clostridiales bacterium]